MKNTKVDEGQLKNWVSLALRVGIAVSLALIVIGFIILIYISGFKNIQPLVRLEQIPAAIVISIGMLVLLLIPIVQVLLSIIFFSRSRSRNRLFIGISVVVLCLSAISLILALT